MTLLSNALHNTHTELTAITHVGNSSKVMTGKMRDKNLHNILESRCNT